MWLKNNMLQHFTHLVLQIADQLLDRVDTLHSRHLIHRDIKPVSYEFNILNTK